MLVVVAIFDFYYGRRLVSTEQRRDKIMLLRESESIKNKNVSNAKNNNLNKLLIDSQETIPKAKDENNTTKTPTNKTTLNMSTSFFILLPQFSQ